MFASDHFGVLIRFLAVFLLLLGGCARLPDTGKTLLTPKTFDELRENGELPRGFQRLIDQHFQRSPAGKNEIVLNSQHRLVRRALEQGTTSPLANVLRILVIAALSKAGARVQMAAQEMQAEDLEAIADAL